MQVIPHKIPEWLKQLYPNRIWNKTVADEKKIIYLTFDDGPVQEVTPWVLDVLAQYEAKATFFWIGDNLQKYPQVAHRVIKEGHRIGNHTFHHVNGWKVNDEEYAKEVLLTEEMLKKQQLQTDLFRPPYGRISSKQAKLLLQNNYKIIMWDVLSKDFVTTNNVDALLQKTIKATQNGSIVVFHDSLKAYKNLKYILPKYLHYFKKSGYHFDTL